MVLKFLKFLFCCFLSFVGRSQVLMGVVPKDTPFLSNHESYKSVCPLAIANCKEDRYVAVSYTHLRAHETDSYLVCRLLLEKKK